MKRVVLLTILTALVAGCGSGRVPVYPASGQATVNGKPAAGWVVVLHPEPPPEGSPAHPLPRALVGPDGRFRLRTYAEGDGAPAGALKLSFTWMPKSPG